VRHVDAADDMAEGAPASGRDGSRDALRIVVPRFGASVVGGAENAMRLLGHALSARGWQVDVWTTTALDEATWSEGFAAGTERDGDLEVRRFRVVLRRHPQLFSRLSHGAYHLPPGIRGERLWSIAQGPYAPSLIRALSDAAPVPSLFSPYLFHPTLYGLPAAPHPRILCAAAHDEPALRLTVVRRAVLAADGLWFHSPEERDLLISEHPEAQRLPSECGVVGIEAPADIDAFAFAARHRLTGPYLYYGGRTAGGKGLEQLIAGIALARRTHPALRLVLSGEAGDAIAAPGVHGVGRLGERERWEAIAGAAAVVVPGTLESLSLLALESWAMGRPCLLNADSPVLAGHIARSGGGFTFRGADELAARVGELLDNPERGATLGAAGRAYVASTYRWDLAEQRLRDLIGAGTQ
jgi:glycosyltransferase involved in cell wall biosynthesis